MLKNICFKTIDLYFNMKYSYIRWNNLRPIKRALAKLY